MCTTSTIIITAKTWLTKNLLKNIITNSQILFFFNTKKKRNHVYVYERSSCTSSQAAKQYINTYVSNVKSFLGLDFTGIRE